MNCNKGQTDQKSGDNLKDEEFCFVSDVREKKVTARSARNRKTHAGKGGRVKFPSDYMTKKELKALNGEVKTYRLNEPMKWDEFKAMPDDLKVAYINALRTKFKVPDKEIAEMLGVDRQTVGRWFRCLGLGIGKCAGGKRPWNKERWIAWINGISLPDPAKETPVVSEEVEQAVASDFIEDVEQGFASLEEIAPYEHVPVPVVNVLPVHEEPVKAIPESGNMTFMGSAEAALNAVGVLLGGANVRICISWEVCVD